MDFLLYIGVLVILGLSRVNKTRDVADDVTIATEPVVTISELPVAANLGLKRGFNAYTFILEELRLM